MLAASPAADVQRILETYPDIAADHGRLSDQRHLVPPGREHRPDIVVAEESVGGAAHEDYIIRIGADAAEDAEYALDEQRRLRQLVEEVREIVQVPDVIALMLVARAEIGHQVDRRA